MSKQRLKLRLSKPAETALKQGHPWIFSDSIKDKNREMEVGEVAVIYDKQDKFLALGLCDPDSPISVRILHRGKPVQLDAAWWQARMEAAIEKRAEISEEDALTDGYRVIHGENDGFPGVVVDRYATVAVLKIYTAAWLDKIEMLKELILANLPVNHVVLRLSRYAQTAGSALDVKEGWLTKETVNPVIFQENGIRFESDVLKGQKTGFFLDQRENRQRVEELAAGRHVLNAFSFSGGFSLYAARGGAKSVTDLDISAHALESSGKNFGLNKRDAGMKNVDRRVIQSDAFLWMEEATKRDIYDLIITDPPTLAKKESEKKAAMYRYEQLNFHAVQRLSREGVLVACSCSSHVKAEEFYSSVLRSVRQAGRKVTELWRTGNPTDHPATFPEAHYLKAIALVAEA
jgi:23S rRNA (cytosine1962-C5)-methyltransferase